MKINNDNNILTIFDDDDGIIKIVNNFNYKYTYTFLIKKDNTLLYVSDNYKNDFLVENYNTLSDLILEKNEYESIRKNILESIFTNKQIISELKIKKRIYNICITPIFIQNKIKYLTINASDITKQKKIYEEIDDLKIKLNESNSIKTNFLSNISHELRTPLNAILGFSELMMDDNKCGNEHFLKPIISNAKHLYELLNNILDSSKIDSNDFDILYEKFSIFELLDELSDIFNDINYSKNLNLVELKFIKNEDVKITSDYIRLKQVLFNIISNAIKFTNYGHITISYDISICGTITIKIEDTGIGIPKDKQNKVFERFWQEDSSSTKKHKGTGLGLSISKRITQLLGGKIWFESKYNEGTTFFIKLNISKTRKRKKKIVENDFYGKTILMIDEVPANYSLLGIYLSSLNFNILTASNYSDAINIYKKKKNEIDLIFLDLNIPDFETLSLIKTIKNVKKCDIITKSDRIGCIQNKKYDGVHYHIQNPVNKDRLLLMLNELLK